MSHSFSRTPTLPTYLLADISCCHGFSEKDHQPLSRSVLRGLRNTSTWHYAHVPTTICTRVYNGDSQILSSSKHSYCRWYKLRPWPLRKRPSAIVLLQSRGSERYPNLALFTYQNSDIPEYTMTLLKYEADLSIYIADDISWGNGLSENGLQPSCRSSLGGLR